MEQSKNKVNTVYQELLSKQSDLVGEDALSQSCTYAHASACMHVGLAIMIRTRTELFLTHPNLVIYRSKSTHPRQQKEDLVAIFVRAMQADLAMQNTLSRARPGTNRIPNSSVYKPPYFLESSLSHCCHRQELQNAEA